METYSQRLKNNENIDEDLQKLVELVQSELQSSSISFTSRPTSNQQSKARPGLIPSKLNRNNIPDRAMSSMTPSHVNPDLSGKLLVLHRLMAMMRAVKNGERIVIVSNYTSTLDLIEKMCK